MFHGTRIGEEPALHLADGPDSAVELAQMAQVWSLWVHGRTVAVTGRQDAADPNTHLYLMDLEPLGTLEAVRELPDAAVIRGFSDDGSKILWATDANMGVYDRTSGSGVILVTWFATGEPKLQPGDGEWLLLPVAQGTEVMRWNGTHVRTVATNATWSGDGTRLLYTDGTHVVSELPDGTDATSAPLPGPLQVDELSQLVSQPGGTHFAFVSDSRGHPETWGATADLSSIHLLSDVHPRYSSEWADFAWAPSGQSVLFSSLMNDRNPEQYMQRSNPATVDLTYYLAAPGGPGALPIGTATRTNGFETYWAPDESEVAVVSTELYSDTDAVLYELHVFPTDGVASASSMSASTYAPPEEHRVQWSPDGSKLYFAGAVNGTALVPGFREAEGIRRPLEWRADSSGLLLQLTSGELASFDPITGTTSIVGAGFELPIGPWALAEPPAAPTPVVHPVTAQAYPTVFTVPDPVPEGHRYLQPAPATAFTAITTGGDRVCALQDDGVATCDPQLVQPDVSWRFSQVSVGSTDTVCGLGLDDSVLRCWGDAIPGLPGNQVAIDVDVGDAAVCAVLEDQSLSCWGSMQLTDPGPFVELSFGGGMPAARRPDGSLFWPAVDPPVVAWAGSSFDSFVAGPELCVLEGQVVSCSGSQPLDACSTIAGRFTYKAGLRTDQRPFQRRSSGDDFLRDVPATGLAFEQVDITDSLFCGLAQGGAAVFCRDLVLQHPLDDH